MKKFAQTLRASEKLRLQKFKRDILSKFFALSKCCHYCDRITIRYSDMRGYENHYRCASIDHKLAVSLGGEEVESNYVLCCMNCNMQKSNRYSYEEFKQMKQQEKLKWTSKDTA